MAINWSIHTSILIHLKLPVSSKFCSIPEAEDGFGDWASSGLARPLSGFEGLSGAPSDPGRSLERVMTASAEARVFG